MSRYIDADVLIDDLVRNRGFYPAMVASAIRNTPTADVLEVVRCKDCEYYKAYEPPIEDFDGWCRVNENEYDKDFYCQYGERREE